MPIKHIKSKLPEGYEVIHWTAEDIAGKHKLFVPTYKGQAIFKQNVTFSSLGIARKKARSHAETQILLKRISDERNRLKKLI